VTDCTNYACRAHTRKWPTGMLLCHLAGSMLSALHDIACGRGSVLASPASLGRGLIGQGRQPVAGAQSELSVCLLVL